jgi:hypothetical protein
MGRLVVGLRIAAIAWLVGAAILLGFWVLPHLSESWRSVFPTMRVLMGLSRAAALAGMIVCATAPGPLRALPTIASVCSGAHLLLTAADAADVFSRNDQHSFAYVGEMLSMAEFLLLIAWAATLLRHAGRSTALVYVAGALLLAGTAASASQRLFKLYDLPEPVWMIVGVVFTASEVLGGLVLLFASLPPRQRYAMR